MNSSDPTTSSLSDIQDIRAGVAMKIDVQTEGGRKILELIEALLAERMMKIAKSDQLCRGLLNVLENIGANVELAAQKSAKILARQAMGTE